MKISPEYKGKVETKIIGGETWFKFNKKRDRQKYFYGNLISVALIVFLLILGSVLTYYIVTRSAAFLENPFMYGAKKIGGNVSCNCFISSGYQNTFQFEFTQDGMVSKDKEISFKNIEFIKK